MPSSGKRSLALLFALGSGLCLFWLFRPWTPSSDQITGIVRNEQGPIVGAHVRIKGTDFTSLSDADGRFRLLSPLARTGRVTAWKDGYLIAGLSIGEPLDLRLVPLPREDHDDYRWVDPAPDPGKSGNCANCHAEIYREWEASGHGRSATGARFRNLYEGTHSAGTANIGWGLLTQHPDGSGVCASCHAPAIPDNDSAAREDMRQVAGIAARGVHCDYCHKIAEVGDGTFGLSHGRFNLRLLRPAREQLFFGPLDDVDRGEDAYSPLYRDSRYCASCHEGVVFGVHVYSTYSEWLDSPARRQGKQCQDCHMPPTGTMTNLAPGRGGIERDPKTLASHRFFAPDRDEMLRRCIRVESEARRAPDGVRATVRLVAENVGHRVPTGFIDRQLILVLEALDGTGKPLAAMIGPKLPPATGPDLNGLSGRFFAKLLTGRDGKAPTPFWLAGGAPEDTRLAPSRVEESVWLFPPATAQLRVRVLYRRFWDEVIRSKGWPDRDTVVHDQPLMVKTE